MEYEVDNLHWISHLGIALGYAWYRSIWIERDPKTQSLTPFGYTRSLIRGSCQYALFLKYFSYPILSEMSIFGLAVGPSPCIGISVVGVGVIGMGHGCGRQVPMGGHALERGVS